MRFPKLPGPLRREDIWKLLTAALELRKRQQQKKAPTTGIKCNFSEMGSHYILINAIIYHSPTPQDDIASFAPKNSH